MNGFSIFMFVFGISVFLVGLYIYTGHKSEIILWRLNVDKASKKEIKNIGKWTMISSIFIFLLL